MSETNERTTAAGAASEGALRRLGELRGALLALHKTLLDAERVMYESMHGRVTGGELLQLVISDPHFAWLRGVSRLVVRIDELLAGAEPATAEEADVLLKGARGLLRPDEEGDEFGRRYFAALQREPDAVLAHRRVALLLAADA